jgi:LacI family transcriptional regulator
MTIKEIALKAGVSIGTVDRVMHKRGRVSQNTIKKVNKIINDADYKPNIFASNLSSSKKYIIGIIMPNEKQDNGYWAIQKSGINQSIKELQIYNLNSIYFTFDKYNVNSFYKVCDNLLKSDIDGLFIR